MMEIFFETKDVFQLKDMEKIAPREKGITAMSVKEVLQSLVDDGMVDSERIGTSNYFWSFPSKALHARKRKLETLSTQFSEGNQKKENLQQSIKRAKTGREDTEERASLSKELASLRQQKEQLKTELEKYKECDPEVVEEILFFQSCLILHDALGFSWQRYSRGLPFPSPAQMRKLRQTALRDLPSITQLGKQIK
ncbi:meiotic nuclear division protein 1 homolog isoform X2 [Notamacropus eugenii]